MSRTGVPGWETGTTGVSQSGQINIFIVVIVYFYQLEIHCILFGHSIFLSTYYSSQIVFVITSIFALYVIACHPIFCILITSICVGYVGNSGDQFSIEFHHGFNMRSYVDEKIDFFDDLEADTWSLL